MTLLEKAKAAKRKGGRREPVPSIEEIELALALLTNDISNTQLLAALNKPLNQRTGAASWGWTTLKRAYLLDLVMVKLNG